MCFFSFLFERTKGIWFSLFRQATFIASRPNARSRVSTRRPTKAPLNFGFLCCFPFFFFLLFVFFDLFFVFFVFFFVFFLLLFLLYHVAIALFSFFFLFSPFFLSLPSYR